MIGRKVWIGANGLHFAWPKEVYAHDCSKDEHGGFFGQGEPNVKHAQYFIGKSYLSPLTDRVLDKMRNL